MPIGVVVGLASGLLMCLVTEIYLHRCLAHRAFRINPVLGSILGGYAQVYGAVHPQRWVGIHRLHHRHADTPLDPHSPIESHPLLVLLGTPYLFVKAVQQLPPDSPSVERRFLALRVLITAMWLILIGPMQTATAVAVHAVCYLGIMGMVNTFGHRAGTKPHPNVPGYDSAWLALLLLGHGYHNSHHAHPAAARMGLLDPMWPIVRLLSRARLLALDEPRSSPGPAGACCMAGVSSRGRSRVPSSTPGY